ncbi:hypothetical protein BC831DRAFT_302730 [Entophlyctis helioformis]|nr:hypothetical protein BC831DRAFT_302730 [Entophlyctis helioformis]
METRDDAFRREVSGEYDRLKRQIQEVSADNEKLLASNRGLVAEKEHLQSDCNHLQARCQELDSQLSNATNSMEVHKRQSQSLSEKVISLESIAKNSKDEIDNLLDQLDKEREAYMHNLERQKSSLVQERLQFTQRIEVLARDNAQANQKIEELDAVLEQQRKLFKGKISSLKDKIKSYKTESSDLRYSCNDMSAMTSSFVWPAKVDNASNWSLVSGRGRCRQNLEKEHQRARLQLDDVRRPSCLGQSQTSQN